MEIIADLHLHSKYSRAVSQKMVIPEIAKWARKKGIDLVSAPDWTHPLFFRELKKDLVEVGEGIYGLKKAVRDTFLAPECSDLDIPEASGRGHKFARKGHFTPFFLLATEISSIYSQSGRVHRIHNLVLSPSFETIEKINAALISQGINLLSDGRPIMGLSAKELAELVFSIDKNCLIIPAHVWTPWYSLYGSRSGFDSLKECFGEFSDQIYAVETGLSSDPAMNWRIEELDDRSIVSFSDAHSPAKLGREATVFKIKNSKLKIQNENAKFKITYQDVMGAIKQNTESKWEIAYTIEFYPEEGKYHWSGHRNCQVRQSPSETQKLGATCPVCGKKLTVGVMHRVEQLAGREEGKESKKGETGIKWTLGKNRPSYVMLVPLLEILSEVENVGVSSQKVENEYNRLTDHFGGEFTLLLKTPIEKIAKIGGKKLAEAIEKVRGGNIFVDPGYDGVFGKVKIWGGEERIEEKKQMSLF